MRIVVTSQNRYQQTPDGAVWTDIKYGYTFWTRYLSVFHAVRVIARVQHVTRLEGEWKIANGQGVEVFPAPWIRGPRQYLFNLSRLTRAVRSAVAPDDAVMLRVPGEIACCLDTWLWRQARPYGVECVGDPYELYAPGSVTSPLRPLLRAWYPSRLRKECARACVAAYVTEHSLQRRYPPGRNAFSTHYSSIELDDDAFVAAPRRIDDGKRPITLAFVGTLDQLYKAPDVVIDAMAECVHRGLDLRLRLVGDGRHRRELEQRVAQRGIAERVEFLGQLAGPAAVRAVLDSADLFVSPSYQEGLPRAMIEAMARGLPCIGSTVGGTGELLPAEEMVVAGDVAGLAEKIHAVSSDAGWLNRAAGRNLVKAEEYRAAVLQKRREALYRELRTRTEAWRPR